MTASKGTLRTCVNGHRFFTSSSCPTCPTCEAERKPADGLLARLSAPARRAFEREGITTLKKLAGWSEEELLRLHGVGPSSIPKVRLLLAREGLLLKE